MNEWLNGVAFSRHDWFGYSLTQKRLLKHSGECFRVFFYQFFSPMVQQAGFELTPFVRFK